MPQLNIEGFLRLFPVLLILLVMFNCRPSESSPHDGSPQAVFSKIVEENSDLLPLKNPALVQQYYETYGQQHAWTSESIEMLHRLLQQSRGLGIGGTDSLQFSYTSNTGQDVRDDILLTDAALSFLFTAAYGEDLAFRYKELKGNADTLYIIRKLNALLVHHRYMETLDSIEPRYKEYGILKAKLNELVADTNTDTVRAQVEQVKQAMNAWRWLQRVKEKEFVLVNIPSASLRLVAKDTVHIAMKVIAGKPSTPTPTAFNSYLRKVIIYPYWTVPTSIARKEMLPKIKRNINYLENNNLQVINNKGEVMDAAKLNWAKYSVNYFPYVLRQGTGCDNSLGLLKFEFISPYGIYLHDTNEKDLFKRENRFLSHGCIRVEKPLELATHVLGQGAGLSMVDSLYRCEMHLDPVYVSLDKPCPLLVLYLTADINADGVVIFYKDVYGRNKNILPY